MMNIRPVFNAFSSRQLALSQKALNIKILPLVPLILTGGALIYNQGLVQRTGKANNQTNWKWILGEGLIGQTLAQYTTGIYPLLGVVLTTYRAGKESNAFNKIQAALQTSITLGMGWLGVHLFGAGTDALREYDDQVILTHLDTTPELAPWINNTLNTHADADHKKVGEQLKQLQDNLSKKFNLPKHEWQQHEALQKVIEEQKSTINTLVQKTGSHFSLPEAEATKKGVIRLLNTISHADHGLTRFSRALNPTCGYILFGLLLGKPIANAISQQVNRYFNAHPSLTARALTPVTAIDNSPLLQSNFLGDASGLLGNPFTPSKPHVKETLGPSITWPEVSDDPLQ